MFAKGKARVEGERFELTRTRDRFLAAREHVILRLEAEHAGRLGRLLDRADGTARIKVKGTDAGGVVAAKDKRVELIG